MLGTNDFLDLLKNNTKPITLVDDYHLDATVILPSSVDIIGNEHTISGNFSPILITGIVLQPDPWLQSHIVPNVLASNKWAYRTLNDARLCLEARAWDLGDIVTIDLLVEQNSPPPPQVGLFGFLEDQKPSPYHAVVSGSKFVFSWRDEGGLVHSITTGWPSSPLVSLRFQFDGTNLSIWINGSVYTAPAGYKLWHGKTPHFGVGAIADRAIGWGEISGTAHDWTYHALKVTQGVLYKADGTRIDGKNNVTPLSNEAVPFCRLMCDAQTQLVHCYGSLVNHSYGLFLPVVMPNQGNFRFRDLNITGTGFGRILAIGGANGVDLDHVNINGGAYSIGSYGGFFSYPINLNECRLSYPSIACFYSQMQSAYLTKCLFGFPGKSAAIFRGCEGIVRDAFINGNSGNDDVFACLPYGGVGGLYEFDGGEADYEGTAPKTYFHIVPHPATPATTVDIQNWALGRSAQVADVLLDSGMGTLEYTIKRVHDHSQPPKPASISVGTGWVAV